jgi:trigger factor
MQVTETVNEGLKRSLKVVVDASELERDFSSRLGELSGQVRLKGFRPGKVPVNHLRRIYGKSVMAEVVQKKVDDSSKMALAERQLKPAYSPQIDLPQDQGEIEKMMDGTGDLAFTMTFEIVPPIEVKDFATLEVEKLTVDVTDQQVDDALGRIAAQNIEFETKPDGDAQKGDRVMLSFVGKIYAEAFEGGSADDVPLVLGSGQFLPGFEDQLIGAKAGETRLVKTEFPADYSVEKLAGKPAEFEVTVKSWINLTPSIISSSRSGWSMASSIRSGPRCSARCSSQAEASPMKTRRRKRPARSIRRLPTAGCDLACSWVRSANRLA